MSNPIILERLEHLYKSSQLTDLAPYVDGGLITQAEADAIAGELAGISINIENTNSV